MPEPRATWQGAAAWLIQRYVIPKQVKQSEDV